MPSSRSTTSRSDATTEGLSAPPITLALRISYEPDRTVVAVAGELDVATAPALAAQLDLLADHPATPIVLDLGHATFLGAAGLGVIARACARTAMAGLAFDVRSMSDVARRTFTAGGLSSLVDTAAVTAPSGPIPASNETVDATLRLVTAVAEATVRGAHGVSVSLERHGVLSTVAASNDLAARMDEHQYDTAQGPCLAAASDGHQIHSPALRRETRWPAFVPLAVDEGIGSVLSTPLVVGDHVLGALNVLSRDADAFGPSEQELTAFFAAQASSVLTAVGADVTDAEQERRLLVALRSRALLSQAQGVLMARRGIDEHGAAELLYRWARIAETTVLQQALDVIASTIGEGPDA